MKKTIKYNIYCLIIILLVAGTQGCDDYFNCLEGNKVLIKETRNPGQFHAIHILGNYNVHLSQDSIFDVSVEAEQNLVPYIITRVNSGILIIKSRDNRCLRTHKPITIYVKSPDIEELNIFGSGKFESDSLDLDELELNIEGSGDMSINC